MESAGRSRNPIESKPAEAKRSGKVISINTGDHRDRVRERRDELVERYTPLVLSIATKMGSRIPASMELKDLIQTGLMALMSAATCYRPEAFPGITFGAYARHRVCGAMLDSIRGRQWQNTTLDELVDHLEPAVAPTIDDAIDHQRKIARVKDAIQYLDEPSRKILASYYSEDGNFESAGEELGIDRRRAGELHAAAIGKLRQILHA